MDFNYNIIECMQDLLQLYFRTSLFKITKNLVQHSNILSVCIIFSFTFQVDISIIHALPLPRLISTRRDTLQYLMPMTLCNIVSFKKYILYRSELLYVCDVGYVDISQFLSPPAVPRVVLIFFWVYYVSEFYCALFYYFWLQCILLSYPYFWIGKYVDMYVYYFNF